MGLLAFADVRRVEPPYDRLFSVALWQQLTAHFRADALAVLGLMPHSRLEIAVGAGLIALKTPSCRCDYGIGTDGKPMWSPLFGDRGSVAGGRSSGRSGPGSPTPSVQAGGRRLVLPATQGRVICPACHPYYFAAAMERAPYCRHSVSRLICPITKEVIDENNPPLVLPNGAVYGTNAVRLLLNDDQTRMYDPGSGASFDMTEVRRVYVM
jgi:hypothetical protein